MATVAILGTMHDENIRKQCNFTLDRMKDIILRFKPDIICGEVRPEVWNKYKSDRSYDGYLGPNEYRKMIIPLCESENIKFMPVDWFRDDMVGRYYLEGKY